MKWKVEVRGREISIPMLIVGVLGLIILTVGAVKWSPNLLLIGVVMSTFIVPAIGIPEDRRIEFGEMWR